MQSITNGTDCGSLGDYLAWNASQWETTKDYVRYFEVDMKDLCFYTGTKRFIKLTYKDQADAINTCTKLWNGHLPNVESDEELDKFYEFAHMEDVYMQTVEHKMGRKNAYSYSILPYMYIGAKKSFWNIYGDYLFNTTTQRVQKWQIDSYKKDYVVSVSPPDRFGPGYSWYLYDPTSYTGSATCVTDGPIVLFLRGVCKASFLWKFTRSPFFVENKIIEWRNILYYVSAHEPRFSMSYSTKSNAWELVEWKSLGNQSDGHSKLLATVKSTLTNMALGTNLWTVYNDSKECNKNDGEAYTTAITFSACNKTQFTCRDGNCVQMEQRCDGKIDCYDESDEMECNLIVFKSSYSKGISPPPKKYSNINDVFIAVDIKKILKVDEIGEIMEIKFKLYLTWIDSRLTYRNLKKNPNLNVLQPDLQSSIWTPVILFSNTKYSDQTELDKKSLIRVLPHKNFMYKKSDMSENQNIYYFHGAENILELSRTYTVGFICTYDMALFPFDTQTCSMNFEQDEVKF